MMRGLVTLFAVALLLGGCLDTDEGGPASAKDKSSDPGAVDAPADDPSDDAMDRIEAAVLRKLAQVD